MEAAAVRLAKAVTYRSAGTVEFVYDSEAERFYFLEVNTRLQVEHGVTEQVWGVDLVRWMIKLAAGDLPPLSELGKGLKPSGHAIQARLYAEDPGRDFQPCPGLLTAVQFPAADGKALRIDTWVEAGSEVPPHYDPMLAKIIVHADTRDEASAACAPRWPTPCCTAWKPTASTCAPSGRRAPSPTAIPAPVLPGRPDLPRQHRRSAVPGTQTTVQDFPGRLGYWAVGVPPSGPMDDRALRLGNRLLGNDEGAAGLEITMSGPDCCASTPRRWWR